MHIRYYVRREQRNVRQPTQHGHGTDADQLGPSDPASRFDRPDDKRRPRQAVRVPDVQGLGVHARDGGAVPPGREAAQPAAVPRDGRAEAVRLWLRQGPVGRPAQLVVRVLPAVPGPGTAVRRHRGAWCRLHDRGGRVERRLRVRRADDRRSRVPGHQRVAPTRVGHRSACPPADGRGGGAARFGPAGDGRAPARPAFQAHRDAGVRPRVFRRGQVSPACLYDGDRRCPE